MNEDDSSENQVNMNLEDVGEPNWSQLYEFRSVLGKREETASETALDSEREEDDETEDENEGTEKEEGEDETKEAVSTPSSPGQDSKSEENDEPSTQEAESDADDHDDEPGHLENEDQERVDNEDERCDSNDDDDERMSELIYKRCEEMEKENESLFIEILNTQQKTAEILQERRALMLQVSSLVRDLNEKADVLESQISKRTRKRRSKKTGNADDVTKTKKKKEDKGLDGLINHDGEAGPSSTKEKTDAPLKKRKIRTAFARFCVAHRQKMRKRYLNELNMELSKSDLNHLLSQKWEEMGEEEKKTYVHPLRAAAEAESK